ncbi:preprotein translocase subunit SecE [Rubrobacter calidifluminis]|uniref:preprotein translocase subunit SecE n=1 Tax=Rubrobacter calidifluminis TaxID=1392640 RepID=UPI00236175F3|nr:preprotein translocase subunit SecE [Rubrobacter calidifluminis]
MSKRRGSTAQQRRAGGKKAQQSGRQRRAGSGVVDSLKEARAEVRRVSWPDREQLKQSTAVVIIVVVVLGIYVTFWDYVFQNLTRLVFF